MVGGGKIALRGALEQDSGRMNGTGNGIGQAFLRESARTLRDVHLPRIELALAELSPSALWWRPHERATSVANLLLHLEGNVRQWIL